MLPGDPVRLLEWRRIARPYLMSAFDRSLDVAIEDLDLLFAAVSHRLRLIVDPRVGSTGEEAARIRASVLECVQAMEQLHATALHEVTRLHGLEAHGPKAPPASR